jgi:hypothetical protein
MFRIKSTNDLLTGVFLILVSLTAFYLSWPLRTTTEVGLGAGFVPRMFAFIQLGLGGMLIVSGFLTVGEEPEGWQLRPLLVLASIAFFGVTIERLGLAVALTGLVLIACTANRGTKFHESLALAVGAVVVAELIFVKALGLSMPLWPPILWES